MKKILSIIILLSTQIIFSQIVFDSINRTVYLDQVYEVNGTEKQIHDLAKEWIALNFNSAKDVIQLDLKNKIILKGQTSLAYNSLWKTLKFIFNISIKEGRYRLVINDFVHEGIMDLSQSIESFYAYSENEYILKLQNALKNDRTSKSEKRKITKLLNDPEELHKKYMKEDGYLMKRINGIFFPLSENLRTFVESELSKNAW
ncbi:DUF4468 domain-containing protein [Arenibacter sp. M-2]|uniref:DUF4468 domain-containing protein n=1 Tax=Arenibacter sp. M-2 TaxID=3053612 RepID=UPI002570D7B2|nr:DUF4468 domain-containing protein [Arenibacter sp. M-2]MDL5514307.1 DUF4468 domain-containing protein [Arenibacter sp. M-2]